jgi:hypothetical protein
MKSKWTAVLAMAAAAFIAPSNAGAAMLQGRVTQVDVVQGSNSFGPYLELRAWMQTGVAGCPNEPRLTIHRAYLGSSARDYDFAVQEAYRQVAMIALLNKRNMTVLTNGCHDGFHAIATLKFSNSG